MLEISPTAIEDWAVGLVLDCLGPECAEKFFYDESEVIELNVGAIGTASHPADRRDNLVECDCDRTGDHEDTRQPAQTSRKRATG